MGSQRTFVFSRAPSRTEWGSRLLLAAPLVVLLLAAGVQAVRLPALTMLVVGLVVLRLTRRPVADAWAACVPIAVSLAWGIGGQPSDASDGSDCANPLSPPATWRLAEAVLVLAAVGLVGRAIGSSRRELGLRAPAGWLGPRLDRRLPRAGARRSPAGSLA